VGNGKSEGGREYDRDDEESGEKRRKRWLRGGRRVREKGEG